jgi:hypothetical protein
MISRFRGHCWSETAFQNVCSFGPVVAACCSTDSSFAVGDVLPVVARLLMNPLNLWLLYPNWLPCMIPKCAVLSLCTFWCRCIYTHYVHHNTFLSAFLCPLLTYSYDSRYHYHSIDSHCCFVSFASFTITFILSVCLSVANSFWCGDAGKIDDTGMLTTKGQSHPMTCLCRHRG